MREGTMRGLRTGAALLIAGGLAACQSSGGALFSRNSPAGFPIAIESIDGAPPEIQTALREKLESAAASRQVDLANADKPPRYTVKGYLSIHGNEEGESSLAFVWDVADTARQRARRVSGTSPIGNAGGKSWASVDQETLQQLADSSMAGIAEFLSSDAQSAAAQPESSTTMLGYTSN